MIVIAILALLMLECNFVDIVYMKNGHVLLKFVINDKVIMLANSKVTDNRCGHFVTCYQRVNNANSPYFHRQIDYLIVFCNWMDFGGLYILSDLKFLLQGNNHKGKMAFRLYPFWSKFMPSNFVCKKLDNDLIILDRS